MFVLRMDIGYSNQKVTYARPMHQTVIWPG